MRERMSLRARITMGATVVVTIALAAGALSAAALLRRSLEQDEETLLDDRVDAVAELAIAGTLPYVLAEIGRDVGQIQVVNAEGEVLAATPGLAADVSLVLEAEPPIDAQIVRTVDGDVIDGTLNERYRYIARTVDTPSGPVTIHAVTSLGAAGRAEDFLRNGLLVGLPFLVAATALSISWLVRRSLAPVDAIRREVDTIEATDLSRRLPVAGHDQEIARLAATLNRLIARLEDDARRQSLFGAAAAHELRSPLTAIRTELEVAAHYPDLAKWGSVVSDVLIEVRRLEQLAADLRVLTRPTMLHVGQDATADLRTIIDADLERRRATSPLTFTFDAPPSVEVRGDVDRVTQVFRNLLDNAVRHAVTAVNVTIHSEADEHVLDIANDGAPIPVDQLDSIFEAFSRLDDARDLDQGGSGLGLAIVRSIMISLGGTVRACPSDMGALFRVTFARPESTADPTG